MRVFLLDPGRLSDAAPPGDEVIHVWQFPLAGGAIGALSESERERANRYRLSRAREQFVAARGMMRTLLGAYLGCPARDVPLSVEPGGKPVLAVGPERDLHFNLTHSGGLGLFAVAGRPVGVDVEELREMPNADGLVQRFYSAEERRRFRTLPEELKVTGFFRAWTCKEALLKAVGRGLADLESCVVELDPRSPPAVIHFDPGEWRLQAWEPRPGYTAALAICSENPVRIESA